MKVTLSLFAVCEKWWIAQSVGMVDSPFTWFWGVYMAVAGGGGGGKGAELGPESDGEGSEGGSGVLGGGGRA